MRSIQLTIASAIALLCSCAGDSGMDRSQRQPLIEEFHLQRMLVSDFPPIIAALDSTDLPLALRRAGQMDAESLARRESARWTGIDSLAYLTGTKLGREFLAATQPRALAWGMPAEACPVTALATGEPGETRAQVAGRALETCLAQVAPAQNGCGCRIVALDNVVTVPRSETAYATGTSARLRAPSLGLDLILVAEETTGGVLLRDLRGEVARVSYGQAEAVLLRFSTGASFEGRRIPVGFRRGRIAERIYASDAAGNRVSLLIGFEPSELAGGAAAWLAWPSEG